MNRITAVAVSLALAGALASTSTTAAPRVSGSTISWPDDGWYQMLGADDFSEICAGGSFCDVSAGRYIVMNHTTGQRFGNVVVRDSSGATMPVIVSGSTISWPDDGWYQVQRADDYSTVCEGVRQCDVDDGVYTVINHSSGMRFTGILVDASNSDPTIEEPSEPTEPGSPTGSDANGITVLGNTISWPDNGWYQVQSLDTFESICEGGQSCFVPDGAYVVINHTLGERFEPYIITGDDSLPNDPGNPDTGDAFIAGQIPPPVNARLDEAAPYLIESLAGYQLEQAQAYIATLGEEIVSTAISQSVLEPTMVEFVIRNTVADTLNERSEYDCSGGGSLLRETAVLDFDELGFSQDNLAERWSFTDCRIDTDAGDLLSGEHVINGDMSFVNESSSGQRFTNYQQVVTYSGFTLTVPGDNSLTIDGNASVLVFDTDNPFSRREVTLNEYKEVRDDSTLRDIRDGNFLFYSTIGGGGVSQEILFSATGRILGTVTEGMDVTINTDVSFARTGVANELFEELRVPSYGQMQLSSTDGSEMSITADPDAPDYNAPVRYDYALLSSSGDTVTGESLPMPTFVITAPEAAFYQR